MISITLNLSSDADIAFARKTLGGLFAVADNAPVRESPAPAVALVPSAPVGEATPSTAKSEDKSPTQAEVHEALTAYVRLNSLDKLKALLARFNAVSLAGVKPEQYAAVLAATRE